MLNINTYTGQLDPIGISVDHPTPSLNGQYILGRIYREQYNPAYCGQYILIRMYTKYYDATYTGRNPNWATHFFSDHITPISVHISLLIPISPQNTCIWLCYVKYSYTYLHNCGRGPILSQAWASLNVTDHSLITTNDFRCLLTSPGL